MSSASSRKEPSMDEILASIRRIIESGDERPSADGSTLLSISPEAEVSSESRADDSFPVAAGSASPVPPFDIHYLPTALGDEALVARHVPDAETEVDERAVIEIHEVEAPSDEEHAPLTVDVEASAPEAETLEHVSDDAWWDAAVAGANDVEAESAHEAVQPTTASADLPAPDNENAVSPAEPEVLRSNWHDVSPQVASVSGDADAAIDAHRAPFQEAVSPAVEPASHQATAFAAIADQPPRPEIPESVIAGASALLSAQAGDQVAAAFDDLARAIREGQLRSMEGMAREIMRPMLQEWLDDNLPRIVERLVREEIERIARGPRR